MTHSIEIPLAAARAAAGQSAPDGGRFSGSGAKSYDARIRRLVPGYSVLQELIAPVLAARIGRGAASILLSGAGTGAELSELAFQSTQWCFTAVDPAADMLAIAGRRAEMLGCLEQVDFRISTLGEYTPLHRHDAALSVLVAHFLPDNGAADFHPVSEARLTELLETAGFAPPVRFFQALDIAGYLTERR